MLIVSKIRGRVSHFHFVAMHRRNLDLYSTTAPRGVVPSVVVVIAKGPDGLDRLFLALVVTKFWLGPHDWTWPVAPIVIVRLRNGGLERVRGSRSALRKDVAEEAACVLAGGDDPMLPRPIPLTRHLSCFSPLALTTASSCPLYHKPPPLLSTHNHHEQEI